jgi:hypothetical protein
MVLAAAGFARRGVRRFGLDAMRSKSSWPRSGRTSIASPGQGIEPRSPRSERGVLPVRRSRNERASPSSSSRRELDAQACSRYLSRAAHAHDVFHATRLPFDPGSPAAVARLAVRRRPAWRSFGARASCALREIRKLKPTHDFQRLSQAEAQRVFLSQAGPRFDLVLLQAGHHLLIRSRFRLRNDEGDPSGSPSLLLLCR